jgi:hypothetical protein
MARRSRLSSFNVLVRASNAARRAGVEVEFVVYGTVAIPFVFLVSTPTLTAAFPRAIPVGSDGFGRFDAPETTLEWTQTLVGALLLGLYVYGRLLFTDLGDEVRTLRDGKVLE